MTKNYDPLASVQAAGPPGTISFVYGLPAPETFPIQKLRSCYTRVFEEKAQIALQYGPEQGYGPLIDFLREKIRRDEGIGIERPQITLTGGAAQGLDLLCTMIAKPGEVVLVEAPTYHESLVLLRNHGLLPVAVPIDNNGLLVDALETLVGSLKKKSMKISFLYTIPTFQNPGGITLSEIRRKAVIDLARKNGILIVEDDVYFDIAFEKRKVTPLYTLAQGKNVVRLGSFSKVISPGLRLGWMVGPPDIIDDVIQSGVRRMGGGANPVTAIAVSFFCLDGLLESHTASVCPVYKQRRDVMLEALEFAMPDGVSWTRPGGGFFIWVTLPDKLKSIEAVQKGKEKGVWFFSGDPFFAGTPSGQHLRLAFSYVRPQKITEGIHNLGTVLKTLL
ncbi:MAG: PLP-dependent aminotransferase family protein [Candidatus Aminicenantes bacterium]|nr:PLP-dependent aminotransferase family protein [Candidatus Aminicenantes bacterium]